MLLVPKAPLQQTALSAYEHAFHGTAENDIQLILIKCFEALRYKLEWEKVRPASPYSYEIAAKPL